MVSVQPMHCPPTSSTSVPPVDRRLCVHGSVSAGDSSRVLSGYETVGNTHARILEPSDDCKKPRCSTQAGMYRARIRNEKTELKSPTAPSKNVFLCHAFSEDGTRLVTGESYGYIKIWDTHDYTFLAESKEPEKCDIFCVSFVGGKNDVVNAVNARGGVSRLTLDLGKTGTSDQSLCNYSLQRIHLKEIAFYNPVTHHFCHMYQFSEDGRTLAYYHCEEDRHFGYIAIKSVTIYRVGETDIEEHELPNRIYCCIKVPFLSENGQSLLVCSQLDGIEVFPDLISPFRNEKSSTHSHNSGNCAPLIPGQAQNPEMSVNIKGDRACWGKKGKYLLVWDSQGKTPCLSVYKTAELRPMINKKVVPEPWGRFELGHGLSAWRAFIMDGTSIGDKVQILISEDYPGDRTRLVVWDVTADEVLNEVVVKRPPALERDSTNDRYLENEKASAIVESQGSVLSNEAYLLLVCEDNWRKIHVSKDGQWVGMFSWQSHKCLITSLRSGVVVRQIPLPENEQLHPFMTPIQAKFDPKGSHFLVFGDSRIHAFTMRFTCPHCSYYPESNCQSGKGKLQRAGSSWRTQYNALVSWLSVLPSKAICPVLLSTPDFKGCDWDVGPYLGKVNQSEIVDGAISANGRCLAFVVHDGSSGFRLLTLDARGRRKRCSVKTDEPTDGQCKIAMTPDRIFLHEKKASKQMEVVIVSQMSKPKAFFAHISKKAPFIPVDIGREKKYFGVHQSLDRQKLVFLTPHAVCFLHLESRTTTRIDYKVNFYAILQLMGSFGGGDWRQARKRSSGKRISDDGKRVLLAWNAKRKESIIVTPETTQEDCEESIRDAANWLWHFCSLSWNGQCTSFVDRNDIVNGRISISFFNEDVKKVVSRCPITRERDLSVWNLSKAHFLLENLFFGLSNDGSSLVVSTSRAFREEAPMYERKRIEEIPLEWSPFHPNKEAQLQAQSESAPDFGMQSSVESLNEPGETGLSSFQAAVIDEQKDKADAIIDKAKVEESELAFEWIAENNEGHDVLQDAIAKNSPDCIRRTVEALSSEVAPFRSAAAIFKGAFWELLQKHTDILSRLLKTKVIVTPFCELHVPELFADPKKRREAAVHVDTSDTCLDWKVIKDPDALQKNWIDKSKRSMAAEEATGSKSRAEMSLKFVRFEDAAKAGMDGIIRPLLLQKAPDEFFNIDVVKWVTAYKWQKVWRSRFWWYAVSYIIFLAVFTVYAVFVGSSKSVSDPRFCNVMLCLLAVSWLYGVCALFVQLIQLWTFIKDGKRMTHTYWTGVRYFFRTKWNRVGVPSSLLLVICIPLFHLLAFVDEQYEEYLSMAIAMEAISAYVKVWFYAQPYRKPGAFVLMVENVIKDMTVFVILASLIWFGFSVSLFVLFNHVLAKNEENEAHDEFNTFAQSLMTLICGAILGDFSSEIYKIDGLAGLVISPTFVVYVLGETVVLLNLMNSLISDTFQRVKRTEEMYLTMGCAKIIDACEAGLLECHLAKINKMIGKYLHVLQHTGEKEDVDLTSAPWSSMTNTLERVIEKDKAKAAEDYKHLKREIKDVRKTVEELKEIVQRM